MTKMATMTSKGQITVPAEVRADLQLETGDKILFERDEHGTYRIAARKRPSLVDSARQRPIRSNVSVDDLDRLIQDSVAEAMRGKSRRATRGARR
ncbi:MAG TPA: AbrB/MazE/SpoVT family DNA-binding domain-containing protein [Hyphomicrobiaceae bacterium]|nr:AbrB/MazE/SpoVT family DNA-binding domain-containing protein [Hyphomicrobiaceae bacterium]